MSDTLGIYIHIPFCRSKCPYCDFFSVRSSEERFRQYTDILKSKISYWSQRISKPVDSIYIGGGTPSLIGDKQICQILDCIKRHFDVKNDCEITMEANPSSGKFFDFEKAVDSGLNRVSIGVQSANENELRQLGRLHTNDDVKNTVELSKNAGIENISLDLMLGIPEQNIASLKESVDFCVSLDVKHISAYILKIEENTLFCKKKDRLPLPDDDETADLYLFAVDYLNQKGFSQYEISNFCKSGFESKHNLKYWKLNDYLGIGPAAHSFLGGERFFYNRSFEDFENDKIVFEGAGNSPEEYLMLRLRLTSGMSVKKYEEAFGQKLSKDFFNEVELYRKNGLMNFDGDRISLTDKGFLVSNEIISSLIQ